MIINKKTKCYETFNKADNLRRKLMISEQAEKELTYMEYRAIELLELEPTPESQKERSELKLRMTMTQNKLLTPEQKSAIINEIATFDTSVYVVSDNTDLASKIVTAAPYLDFILDNDGNLVDIILLPKPAH